MGAPKMTLPFRGSTMVEAVVAAASASGAEPVVVVTGFHGEEVASAVRDRAVLVDNPDPTAGNASSLRVGLAVLDDVDAAAVLLGDMPGVDPEVVRLLATRVIASGATAGIVHYTDGPGHPIVLSSASFLTAATLEGPRALWRFIARLDEREVLELGVNSASPVDVNTTADYHTLLERDR